MVTVSRSFLWSAVRALVLLLAGALLSYVFWSQPHKAKPDAQPTLSEEVLYWVAPMDSHFRRDQPGLSPMGMELIPVYANAKDGGELPGTVSVSPAVEQNLGVRTAQASREQVQPQINTVGLIGHDEDSRVRVTLRAEGWIEQLQVAEPGDHVQQGSKLFEFYSPELVHAQEEYVSALAAKDARLLRGALGRLQAFAIPTERIEQLNKTRQVPRTISYFAPASGHVTQLNVREGSYTDPAKVVLELVSINSIWVRAEVFERQAGRVRVGQPASMRVDYLPAREWIGRVDYVFPMLDMTTRTQQVRLRFDNPDQQLKPNMFSRVSIHTQSFDALTVPREALIRTGNGVRVVLSLGDGQYRSVPVSVGREIGEKAVILAGLSEGDRVVISSQFLLDSESNIAQDLQRLSPNAGEQP